MPETEHNPDEVIDHGDLDGLAGDDHSQYHNTARHDADDHSSLQVTDTGTYAGNNSGPRDITVAFTPRWVIIISGVNYHFHIGPNYSMYQSGAAQTQFSSGGTLGTNKFTVGNNATSANATGTNYDWFAYK